ncbi:histidine kinase [Rhodocytophaga aerolata]|uniref:Histidine kinase n=1 Tax=Rhodocytophaga aerolata TaxID=455078 RepID=A0ABT8R0V2_9BACT|nr:histidine kinase [Rhodocytophaga aerolata]MDO1445713.1 histidine kinase [Rhodocytophaga aerolata]
MQEIQTIRRFELAFVLLAANVHVAWRLYLETTNFKSMNVAHVQGIEGYNQILNNFIPVIAGTVLLLMAWHTFHYIAYPKFTYGKNIQEAFGLTALAIVFVIVGVWLFYYFKLYIHRYVTNNVFTHVRVYSEFRKMTVFKDSIGIIIIMGIYEVFAQVYYYLHQHLAKENISRLLSYFFMACLGTFLVIAAFLVQIPVPLWQGDTSRLLLLGGILLQIYFLQSYLYEIIIPLVEKQDFGRFTSHITIGFLLAMMSTFIIWGCYREFRWIFTEPIAIISAFSLFCSGVIAYVRTLLSREKRILQTQVSSTSAELASLRSQINPHFLFNALNSLYATALKENSDKTADGIQKLGDMMHFMFQENNQDRIPLSKEVEYLHNYIAIQRMRIDESQGVEIRVNIQEPGKEIYMAPMLLNPFVENAFKHGISLQNPSWIFITLTLDATKLYFKVHNSLHMKRENDPEQDKSGVGLANVKKRLALIYPNRHTLEIQQSDKDFFVALTLVYW